MLKKKAQESLSSGWLLKTDFTIDKGPISQNIYLLNFLDTTGYHIGILLITQAIKTNNIRYATKVFLLQTFQYQQCL